VAEGAIDAESSQGQFFEIQTSVADDATTVAIAGSVDMLTAPQVSAAVAAVLASGPQVVIVDLSRVDFLGSAGLSVLVESARRAEDGRSALVVVANTLPTLHALEITGLDSVLTVAPTAGEALARLTDRPV
jgi:anti-anti-sigma factor